MFLRISVGLFVVICWYLYARWLSKHHGNPGFAMVPLIIKDSEGFRYVMKFLQNWIYQYYSYETYVLLCCAGVFIVFGFRQINRLLFTITVLYVLACLCYIYLFFNQFAHHDYYFIATLPFPLFF